MHDLSPAARYSLLVSVVQPRPIAFVSTLSPQGLPNLAPFSFYMVGGSNPPSLMVSPVLNPHGDKKDSLINIEATGEFVVNSVHREMAEGMNQASYSYPHGRSEWEAGGFTALPSVDVKPPRVAEALVAFECRLFQVVAHGSEGGSARYVIGEVIRAHIAEHLWNGTDIEGFRPISRMGGPHYLDTDALGIFTLERPTAPPTESK